MTDPLEIIWACLDTPEPLFSRGVMMSWPAAVREWLISNRILRETTAASRMACPSCLDGHIEDVLLVPGSAPARFFIPCPECLRVDIDADELRRWTVDSDAVAVLVGKALNLTGKAKSIASNRLWRLGTTAWQNGSREVLLARGLHANDASAIAAHVGREGRPIVLVAKAEPPIEIWPGRRPACVGLERVLAFNGSEVIVDPFLLHDLVRQADQLREQMEIMPLDPKAKKLTVRRQLKAEIKGHLHDDVLIAARLEHGSVRKAAKALTAQLGRPVTKDQVQGAINRAGGLKAIGDHEDSGSIQRTVASQPRDRQKKIAQRR